jgi:putative SOS response-associated peptidase YedK
VDLVRLQSTHASVESVVVETTEWAKRIKSQRVKTVDREFYQVIDAIHASPRAAETNIYAAVLVTDNVAINGDGFYDWRREGNRTVLVWIHLKKKEPFALAGLWDSWRK